MKIFYCPKCKKLEVDFKFKNYMEEMLMTTWINCRDGYGSPITHIVCPKCGHVLSGIMNCKNQRDQEEINYIKATIALYSLEIKDGGYIMNGELEKLIKDIEAKYIKRRKLNENNISSAKRIEN